MSPSFPPTLSPLPPALPLDLPLGQPPTLDACTPHTPWQPAPGHPLKPAPLDQGELGPLFPPASPELGKVSLEQVIRLLWGLQSQVNCIERTLLEQTKINQEVCTNAKNISQTVNVIKNGLAQLQHSWAPTPLKIKNPLQLRNSPGCAQTKPIGKVQPYLGDPAPIIPTGPPRHNPLSFFNPYPSLSFPSGPAPAAPTVPPATPAAPAAAPQATPALPPAHSTVKVDHPDAFKGKIGLEAKQWLTCMLAWMSSNQVPGRLWQPQCNPSSGAEIASLTQTALVLNTLLSSARCKWNLTGMTPHSVASLQGLHWEVQKQIATRERQPRTLRELQDAALIIDNALHEESQPPATGYPLSSNPNYVLEEERNCRRAEGLCVKCGKPRHKFAECWTGWKATPKEDKGKAKETAKIGKDSEYQLGKETLLWSHAAILGLKWLDAHNPEIDWNQRTLSFPHAPPEHVAIAKEEEANKNPLEGVPSKYHQYAKVFGEEFNKLPPHWHYNIGIELTEEGPLNSPLYSMTDAKSATLKDWLRDKLKARKICPSKLSISSPVMFTKKNMYLLPVMTHAFAGMSPDQATY
ncbi:Retrotransposon-derived protein PEG10 [Rhizoctonia solani]|uniref:Retrotransposon-derived protein PEG10 n=1 Tax=Rhizoctonia solani TaxID=456999 RepID=A0A8H8NUW5_9AGAM|nr:Retrotransposon-derived protein PEG10 [Rhizoctonia solani]QRW18617.1 Retrotransposon-derived protein PEG10 [Rhizoctonia solani]